MSHTGRGRIIVWILKTPHTAYAEKVGEAEAASETAPTKPGRINLRRIGLL